MQKALRWEYAYHVQKVERGSVWWEWSEQGDGVREGRVWADSVGHIGNFVCLEMESHWKILNGVILSD